MNSGVRRLLLVALTARPLCRVWAPFLRGRATVFMLHRFADPDLGTSGHDPILLRQSLAYLRREGYKLIDLSALFRDPDEARGSLDGAVAFTMDDGYLEQAVVAAPIFAEFDCPVTTFVTTGFLDGATWFWWDRVEYVFDHTTRAEIAVPLEAFPLRYSRDSAGAYRQAQADFTARCKEAPEHLKVDAILRLAEAADVEVPHHAPLRYAPMSWYQVRDLEQRGLRFAPHSVTHPILARTTPDQSHREIKESWTRLRAEAAYPVPIFCYPNGQPDDYGPREITTLRALGFAGAVAGTTGYARSRDFASRLDGAFRVGRFGYPRHLREVAQCVSGLERVNQWVRGQT